MKESTVFEELQAGHSVTVFTVGVSMRPLLIERKTHVMLKPIDKAENLDILLYARTNGKQVLHRLLKQDSEYYYMRGDNTFGLERIRKEQAFGVVAQIYRKGKYIDVSSDRGYACYVRFWLLNYPFRFVYHQLRIFASQLWHKIKGK